MPTPDPAPVLVPGHLTPEEALLLDGLYREVEGQASWILGAVPNAIKPQAQKLVAAVAAFRGALTTAYLYDEVEPPPPPPPPVDPGDPPPPTDPGPDEPDPLPAIGAPTLILHAGTVETVGTGIHTPSDGTWPFGTGLAQALRMAKPGDVIGIAPGVTVPGASIGGGESESKPYVAFWRDPDGNPIPISGVTVIGLGPNRSSRLEAIGFTDNLGGWDGIRFSNLTLVNVGSSAAALLVAQGSIGGLITVDDVDTRGSGTPIWEGRYAKWWFRLHGSCRLDARRVRFGGCFGEPPQEHDVYGDNFGADGKGGFALLMVDCEGGGGWRTMVQVTNRAQSNPTGQGPILLLRCISEGVIGQGGSDFTIAGHLGAVRVIECESHGLASGSQGAVVIWTDHGHGAYLTADGYSTPTAEIRGLTSVHPNADRSHVAASGVGVLTLGPGLIQGNRTALDIDNEFGGGTPTGKVILALSKPASADPIWQAAEKVKKAGVVLSAMAIDALVPVGGPLGGAGA